MFFLVINIVFDDDESKELFLRGFKILQEYCLKNENKFLFQFEYAISDKNSKKIIIIEKYSDKISYLNIHRKSKHFLDFKNKVKNLKLKIEGESYIV